jgi:hypothetical protein
MHSYRSWQNDKRERGRSLFKLEKIELAQQSHLPHGYRQEVGEGTAEASQARSGNSLQILTKEESGLLKLIREMRDELVPNHVRFIMTAPNDIDNKFLTQQKTLISLSFLDKFFRVSEQVFVTETQKERELDVQAIIARIREENPQLYRRQEIATIEVPFEEIHNNPAF